jgi:hypothetical protein
VNIAARVAHLHALVGNSERIFPERIVNPERIVTEWL